MKGLPGVGVVVVEVRHPDVRPTVAASRGCGRGYGGQLGSEDEDQRSAERNASEENNYNSSQDL